MNSNEIKPEPITVLICGVCSQPWDKHLEIASERLGGAFTSALVVSDEDVSVYECIVALQEANRGPQGPAGPQGAMGAPGKSGIQYPNVYGGQITITSGQSSTYTNSQIEQQRAGRIVRERMQKNLNKDNPPL